MKIILATHNLHKREELLTLVGDAFEIEVLPDDFPEIPETGSTLEENALIKARFVFETLHQPTFADDTGLEVDALDGAPGVYTARYAGENATYKDNCQKLLHALKDKIDRSAKFITVICFIDEKGSEYFYRGEVKGMISEEALGTNGFGYDPVFMPLDDAKMRTFAQMETFEKNTLSHRSRAMQLFLSSFKFIR